MPLKSFSSESIGRDNDPRSMIYCLLSLAAKQSGTEEDVPGFFARSICTLLRMVMQLQVHVMNNACHTAGLCVCIFVCNMSMGDISSTGVLEINCKNDFMELLLYKIAYYVRASVCLHEL